MTVDRNGPDPDVARWESLASGPEVKWYVDRLEKLVEGIKDTISQDLSGPEWQTEYRQLCERKRVFESVIADLVRGDDRK